MTHSKDMRDSALPCPDPECGGEMFFRFGKAAQCRKCTRAWGFHEFSRLLASVQAELEVVRSESERALSRLADQRDRHLARIASLERQLAEAQEALACGIGDDALPPWDGYLLDRYELVREWEEGTVDEAPTGRWLLDADPDRRVAAGTLAECLSALRTELAAQGKGPEGVKENGDDSG